MAKSAAAAPGPRAVALTRKERNRLQFMEASTSSRNGITHTLGEVSYADSGELTRLMLDELQPTPRNPRWGGKRGPTWDEVQHPETIDDEHAYLRPEVQSICEISISIEKVGQITPIDVFKNKDFHEIICGECRYWALKLWALRSGTPVMANVILRPDPPQRVYMVRYVENARRRGLDVASTLFSLTMICQQAVELSEKISNAKELEKYVGLSETMAYRWWAVLEGPEDVRVAIAGYTITNITHAYAAAQEEDAERRAAIIRDQKWQTQQEPESLPAPPPPPPPQRSTRKGGRPRTTISLGKLDSPEVIQWMAQTLDPEGDHGKVDWRDFKSATRAWAQLLKKFKTRWQSQGNKAE